MPEILLLLVEEELLLPDDPDDFCSPEVNIDNADAADDDVVDVDDVVDDDDADDDAADDDADDTPPAVDVDDATALDCSSKPCAMLPGGWRWLLRLLSRPGALCAFER